MPALMFAIGVDPYLNVIPGSEEPGIHNRWF
jgi:hypothetical protein